MSLRNGSFSRRLFSSIALAGVLQLAATLISTPVTGADEFRRGDVNGDGRLDLQDVIRSFSVVWGLDFSFQFVSECTGTPVSDGADSNDNEYFTLADGLQVLGGLFLGRGLPPAPGGECGTDPDDSTRGFEATDPAFGVCLSEPKTVGDLVQYVLRWRSNVAVDGIAVYFEHSPDLARVDSVIDALPLSGAKGRVFDLTQDAVALPVAAVVVNDHRFTEPLPLPSTGGEWMDACVLRFRKLTADADVSLTWLPEVTASGRLFRATQVSYNQASGLYEDHHPEFSQCPPEGPFEGEFIRGDVNGDGAVMAGGGENDAQALLAFLWQGGPAPVDCTDKTLLEAADVNDNEYFSIADYLHLRRAAAEATTISAPTGACGLDPDQDRRGFDVLEPEYQVTTGNVVVESGLGQNPARGRSVLIPLSVRAPRDVLGLQVILDLPKKPDGLPEGSPAPLAPFTADEGGFLLAGRGVVNHRLLDGGAIAVSIHAVSDDEPLAPGSDGPRRAWSSVGTLRFHLADYAAFRPILWIAEQAVNGVVFRASVVDADSLDHHPDLVVGEYELVRGNANGDGAVDISDPKFTFDFLFLGGRTPNCLDAADANDDGAVDISDGIFTLNYLFLGGPVIPQPYPQCGLERGAIDDLSCNPPEEDDACFEQP